VSVTSYNRKILLTGQVPDATAKADAERAARQMNGVREVFNELEIGPRVSMTTIATDTTLTARVKTSFLEQKVLDSNAVKVVTENGVVYLMGLVTQREGPAYATVASRVTGVKRVVTLFEYIGEDELARLKAR
jgi:osmotically-inducible protein OsmY